MTPKLYDTIEFGIDDKGAGPSLELGALIEFLRQDTLDGQTIEQGSALELAERVAELERANTQLVHGCERAMSDFRTTKAYAEETESQLRKRVVELETKAADVVAELRELADWQVSPKLSEEFMGRYERLSLTSSDWSGGEAGAYRAAAQEVEQLEIDNEALTKRVAELEAQVTEQRAVPIPMGLGEVCVSECHDGDGVLREMVIHARRAESQPVGTPLPDGYIGLPLPNGEILARIRIENADGARLVLLDSLERCINAAYVADGKAPMPTRADLQSQRQIDHWSLEQAYENVKKLSLQLNAAEDRVKFTSVASDGVCQVYANRINELETKAAEVVAELRRREESEWYADEHAQGAYRESADLITEKLGLK